MQKKDDSATDPTDKKLIHRYLIQNLQDPGGLLFHNSSPAPDDLRQFGGVFVQLRQELCLQWKCCYAHELSIYLENISSIENKKY